MALDWVQESLEKILRPAGLLRPVEEDSGSAVHNDDSIEEKPAKIVEPNVEELLGLTTEEEVQQTYWKMAEARCVFDHRQIEYRRKFEDFQRLVAKGNPSTRSEFDRQQLKYEQGLTRNLIDAENFI